MHKRIVRVWAWCGLDDIIVWQPPLCEMTRVGGWFSGLGRQLTDYPGNGRGAGVVVSPGQIRLPPPTFVKICSCARCRNAPNAARVEQKYKNNAGFVHKHLLSRAVTHSSCRVQLELERLAEMLQGREDTFPRCTLSLWLNDSTRLLSFTSKSWHKQNSHFYEKATNAPDFCKFSLQSYVDPMHWLQK